MKLWEGRFKKELDSKTNDFNASIHFDNRLYKEDIMGSIAHVTMLGKQGIIEEEESNKIINELKNIKEELEKGSLEFDFSVEDIHSFIEKELTKRLGDTGKRVHTARSRNDQVAVDMRLYIRNETDQLITLLKQLIRAFLNKSKENTETIMPGYTHLQRAQPITFAHHLMAYVEMFLRDMNRLEDMKKRMNENPLGSCALAGTTYPTDRFLTSQLLGFSAPCKNSLDGVSDRDYLLEFSSALSIIMVHLSRISEEIILWSSWEFKFITLDDSFSTGSSIMPQKKNPDITELIRGKAGRIFGHHMSLLTMMKSLPLAYNKDMQEDKEAIFDSIDNVKMCIQTFIPMLQTMTIMKDNMLKAAKEGFINATDCADYLTKKGLPFRSAYQIVGRLVSYAMDQNKTLDTLSLEEYKQYSNLFEADIYDEINLITCINNRTSYGGPAPENVKKHIEEVEKLLENI